MSSEILKIAGAAIIALALIICIRRVNEAYAPLVRAASVIVFFGVGIGMLAPIAGFTEEVFDAGCAQYGKTVMKALGISFLTGICAEVCRSAGESGLATGAENIGKTEILLLALPMLREVLSVVEEMLSW